MTCSIQIRTLRGMELNLAFYWSCSFVRFDACWFACWISTGRQQYSTISWTTDIIYRRIRKFTRKTEWTWTSHTKLILWISALLHECATPDRYPLPTTYIFTIGSYTFTVNFCSIFALLIQKSYYTWHLYVSVINTIYIVQTVDIITILMTFRPAYAPASSGDTIRNFETSSSFSPPS